MLSPPTTPRLICFNICRKRIPGAADNSLFGCRARTSPQAPSAPMLDEARIMQIDKNATTSSTTSSQHPRRAQATGPQQRQQGQEQETSHTNPGIPRGSSHQHCTPQLCPCHVTPNGSSWLAVLIRVSQDVINTGSYPRTGSSAISGAQGWQRGRCPCSSQSQQDTSRESRCLSDLNT